MRRRAVAVAVAAALAGGGIAAGIASSAASAANNKFGCTNGGGNTVQGQCNGEGLTVTNPAGNTPPGQQP